MTKFSRFQNTITDFTCTSFLCGSSELGLQNSWVVIKCSFCELYPHSQYLWILKMDSSMSPWLCPFLVFYLATLFYCDCVSISTVLSARAWPQWLQKKKNLGNDCTKCDLNTEAFTPATETWWICLSLSQNDGWCNSEKKEKKLQKCWCRNRRSWNRKQSYQRGLFFISCRLTHDFQPLHLPHCHLRI